MHEDVFVLAAQVNSSSASRERLQLSGMIEAVRRGAETARLDILIAGGDEIPEFYQAVTDRQHKPANSVFLWYDVLSDNSSLQPGCQVVNFRGGQSLGWGSDESQQQVGESFMFACPNNPLVQADTLANLERLLTTYPFDGVFLDKIRFPSPANGIEEVFSCFCPHCRAAALREGLDIDEVQNLLGRLKAYGENINAGQTRIAQSGWLETLIGSLSQQDARLLASFLRFRANSITRLVEAFNALTVRLGVQLSLDLFSPGLAYLVGQDYPALSKISAWIKPMVYRYANGPAGLRLEVPQMARGLARVLDLELDAVERWVGRCIPEMAATSITGIEQDGAPPALIRVEVERAVALCGTTPVYLGIEAVSIPAFHIHIRPEYIREMLVTANQAGAKGAVLSWDLLHMPAENLIAARQACASP